MKKIYILSLLTASLYIELSSPYSYAAVLPDTSKSPCSVEVSDKEGPANNTPDLALNTLLKLIKQGDECYDQNDHRSAIIYYNKAMKQCCEKNKDKVLLLAQIFNNIGMSYLDLKVHHYTFFCYYKALMIRKLALEKAKSYYNPLICKAISELIGKSYHNIGLFYLDINKPKKAIISFEAALETEWQHHVEAIDSQSFLAWAYMREKYYQESSALYKAILVKQRKNPYLSDEEVKDIRKYLQKATKKAEQAQKGDAQTATASKHQASQNISRVSSPLQAKKEFLASAAETQEVNQKEKEKARSHQFASTKNAPFSCNRCKLTFNAQNEYIQHISCHKKELPFVCAICLRKFPRQQQMQQHMYSHIGEKLFECTFCYRKFTKKNNLQKHIMAIHKSPIAFPN